MDVEHGLAAPGREAEAVPEADHRPFVEVLGRRLSARCVLGGAATKDQRLEVLASGSAQGEGSVWRSPLATEAAEAWGVNEVAGGTALGLCPSPTHRWE